MRFCFYRGTIGCPSMIQRSNSISLKSFRGKLKLPNECSIPRFQKPFPKLMQLDVTIVYHIGQSVVLSRHELGCRSASVDIEYSKTHMDFLTPCGFLFLGLS